MGFLIHGAFNTILYRKIILKKIWEKPKKREKALRKTRQNMRKANKIRRLFFFYKILYMGFLIHGAFNTWVVRPVFCTKGLSTPYCRDCQLLGIRAPKLTRWDSMIRNFIDKTLDPRNCTYLRTNDPHVGKHCYVSIYRPEVTAIIR